MQATRRSFITASSAAAATALSAGLSCRTSPEARRDAAAEAGVSYASEGIKREKLKITDVKVTPLSYVDPKKNLWRTGRYIVWKTDAALCQIFTDQGIVGIAEGTPYSGPDNIQKYTEEKIKPALIGQNPFDVDFIACPSTYPGSNGPGETPWNSPPVAAWAGVNNACWDIIGKAKNMPVYKLLAKDTKPEPRIRVYASGGVEHEWYNHGDNFLIEEAVRYKEMGFTAFKFRSGTDWRFSKLTMKQYIPILHRLRQAVGPEMDLMHESLGGLTGMITVEEIVKDFCPVLEELKIHWFEQPFAGLDTYIAINRALKTVMVSGGEMNWSRTDIKPWIDSDAIDIVQTDTNTTGLSENWTISRMAHLRGKYHCPHNWHGGLTTIGNAHLVAAIPNRHMLELNTTYNPLKEEIFKDPLVVKKGFMDLPDRPGYGVELIADVEKKFAWAPGSFMRPNPVMG